MASRTPASTSSMPRVRLRLSISKLDYKERDSTGLILLRQFGIEPETPHESQRAKHLTLTTSSSAATVRPNLKFELTVDIAMEPRVHVYAPGVEGYIPIAWAVPDSAGWKVRTRLEFPGVKDASPGGHQGNRSGVRRQLPPAPRGASRGR